MQPLRIDVWSDIACPWCYVGKRRLEAALAQFPRPTSLVWRSFELDPGAPKLQDSAVSPAARLARKYGTSVPEAEAMLARTCSSAETGPMGRDGNRMFCRAEWKQGRLRGCVVAKGVRAIAIVLGFVAGMPTPASAWGSEGHRLVAEVAQGQLTAAARADIDRLLAREPGSTLASI